MAIRATGSILSSSVRGWDNGIVDSVEQARYKVREHKRRGADLIKMIPSGGVASSGDDPNQQLMTNEEMQAIVQSAHALGMKVAAHVYPAAVIENAVRAGVDSIEHGSFATAQTFALMKAQGTYLVPTLTVYDLFYATATRSSGAAHSGYRRRRNCATTCCPRKICRWPCDSGVKIAYGTDIGEGDHAMEFGLLVANGMSAGRRADRRHPQRRQLDRRGRSDRHDPAGPFRRHRGDRRRSAADARRSSSTWNS